METHDVALIGCGLLGSAFARAFARSGHSVVAWNRTFERAEALADDGIVPVRSAAEAVRSAPLVVACTIDVEATRSALESVDDWGGKTLVNLSTGLPREIQELACWATERGARYLDGGPCCYPRNVGAPETVIYYSGSPKAWTNHEQVLICLGGSSRFVSEQVAMAKTMLLGAVVFLIPALGAFAEAAKYMHGQGISGEMIVAAARPFVSQMPDLLEDAATAIVSDSHETDQATLDVWADGLRTALAEVRRSGHPARVSTAAMATLDAAEAAGLGKLDFSAQVKVV